MTPLAVVLVAMQAATTVDASVVFTGVNGWQRLHQTPLALPDLPLYDK